MTALGRQKSLLHEDLMVSLANKFFLVLTLILITSCTEINPFYVNTANLNPEYVDPELYKVSSDLYPTYRITTDISEAPRVSFENKLIGDPLSPIKTSDVWSVVYSFEGNYFIYSPTFQNRQETFDKDRGKLPPFNYYIYTLAINQNGKVIGIVPLKNPEVVRINKERWLKLSPKYWANAAWQNEPSFKQIEK